jgi:hypothetical protein
VQTEHPFDVVRPPNDVGVGELEHDPADRLQLVPPLRIAPSIEVGDVTAPPRDLDDHWMGLEQEIHPSERRPVPGEDDLATGAWQAGPAHEAEEPPLEPRVAA